MATRARIAELDHRYGIPSGLGTENPTQPSEGSTKKMLVLALEIVQTLTHKLNPHFDLLISLDILAPAQLLSRFFFEFLLQLP